MIVHNVQDDAKPGRVQRLHHLLDFNDPRDGTLGRDGVRPLRHKEVVRIVAPVVVILYVIGVPDKKYGEELMAWIKTENGAELTEAAVKEFCRGQIAHFKIPRYVKFVDEFPMTVSGKIMKFKMREMAIEELGLETESKIETA